MQRLRQHHRALEALADRLQAIVERPYAVDSGLAQIRLAMSHELRDHLAHQEQILFAPLRASPALGEKVRKNDKALIEMRMRYSSHIASWPPERIEREWPAYAVDVKGLLEALRSRIRHEEGVVYPALGVA